MFECRGSLLWNVPDTLFIYVLRFIVSKVKMPCSCSPKAKAIQSPVGKQNNCPSFGNKSTSPHIPTVQASFVSIYMVSTAECGQLTTDYGLGIKHRTKHYGLGIRHGLGYKTRTGN